MYLVESYVKDGLYLALHGGKKDDGTNVVTSSTKNTDTNSHWAFVYPGIGDSGKEEYHILNRTAGTYLSSIYEAKNRDKITCGLYSCGLYSPWRKIVRWNVVPVRNKMGLYRLVPIRNTKQCIGISGGGKADRGQAMTWDNTSEDRDVYWYLRLVPDAIHNGVDTGVRGPVKARL